jgi:hypothetical protein
MEKEMNYVEAITHINNAMDRYMIGIERAIAALDASKGSGE